MEATKTKAKAQTQTDNSSKTTTDHEEIRRWVEDRGGKPALVKGTEGKDDEHAGLLRIKFQEDEKLEETDWETFFATFDEKNLQFLYQEETKEHKTSRFFKFISDKK